MARFAPPPLSVIFQVKFYGAFKNKINTEN